MVLRNFRSGDEQVFSSLVNVAFKNLEHLGLEEIKRRCSSPSFDPNGFFVAEESGSPIGCIGIFNLPQDGFLEIRYLAVKNAFANLKTVNQLIDAALVYAVSRKPKMLKADTLAVQPYVKTYEQFGFKPVRRILRIGWDLTKVSEEQPTEKASIIEVGEDSFDEACQVFVEGLQPYWDWWIEEEGGMETVQQRTAEWMRQIVTLAMRINNQIVGVTSIFPRQESEEAPFLGVMVLPQYRMKGIGWTLMKAALNKARQLGYKRLVVHTLAYIDSLAPGAVLYLKSGGKIEADYLHLIKEIGADTQSCKSQGKVL